MNPFGILAEFVYVVDRIVRESEVFRQPFSKGRKVRPFQAHIFEGVHRIGVKFGVLDIGGNLCRDLLRQAIDDERSLLIKLMGGDKS